LVLGITDPVRFLIDLAAFFAIYSTLSVSLNLEYGFCGIPNLGKVLFFAAGAFAVGGLFSRLTIWVFGLNLAGLDFAKDNALIVTRATLSLSDEPLMAIGLFVLMLAIGAGVGGILGLLASYPAIRLREDYLGIMLLITGELWRYIGQYYNPIVGGTLGVGVPNPFSWIANGGSRELVEIGVLVGLAGLSWFIVERLVRAPFGRSLRAVRDHEEASEAFGKNIVRIRMNTLIIGSAIAGLAGAMYAFYVGAVIAADFTTQWTFFIFLMVTLGGRSNNIGSMLGTFIYVFTFALIRQYKYYITVPFDLNYLAVMIFGFALLIMLIRKPDGLLPETPGKTADFQKILDRLKIYPEKKAEKQVGK
jgi:branched-chain amino acid transport system permease protein